jgi:hypothetical protein
VNFWDLGSGLVINGEHYTLAGDIKTLAADIAAHPSGNYALAKSYDAKADGTYTSVPIPTQLTGKLEGLGNAILHLTIEDNMDYDIGLFGETAVSSAIENLTLSNVNVTGSTIFDVGGLAGILFGTARNVRVTGNVSGSSAEVGAITGINAGFILQSSAQGKVLGAYAGGLAGENGGTIGQSYAEGSEGGGLLGGLAGLDDGLIADSYATAPVTAGSSQEAGGLAGSVFGGAIERSFATGAVTGGDGSFAGGVTGYVDGGTVDQSFSTRAVSVGKNGAAGGLIAGMCSCELIATVINSYASGSVHAESGSMSGGLAGFIQDNEGSTITGAYSTGAVSGDNTYEGGFIGFDDNPGDIASGFWDLTTSGISNPARGAGNVKNDPGIAGLTDDQLKSGLPAGFDPQVWGQSASINNGYPYLLANPPPKNAPGKRKRH